MVESKKSSSDLLDKALAYRVEPSDMTDCIENAINPYFAALRAEK